jgi:hypothetical protein
MDVSALRGAQSFQVKTVDGRLKPEDLKALEHNGKADIVLHDEATHQTHILSGEKINLNEYHQRMGKANPAYGEGAFFNADLRPLQQMDANKDGALTEAEAQYSLKEAASQGLNVAGKTVSGMFEIGALNGMVVGSKLPLPMQSVGIKAGVIVGGILGAVAGVVAAPIRGAAATAILYGKPETPQRWNLTDNLQDIR